MVKFGERLKAARTAKHMSQQALADVIGKSLNTVGLYERGLRQPSLETLCLLADTLDVSCDYLLAGMCRKCGCYVEIRAILKDKHCANFDDMKW